MITYTFDAKGGFVAGDSETGFTVYAYPSSEHATAAKKNPAKVAEEMILPEIDFRTRLGATRQANKEYDRRNWMLINCQQEMKEVSK